MTTNLPLLTDAQIASLKGETLMFDSEFYPNLSYVAFQHTSGVIEFEWPFNLDKFLWVMSNFRTVGFYSNKYDIPMIGYALTGAGQEQLQEASQYLVANNVWPEQFAKERNFTIPQVDTIDISPVCPLKGSLKLYAARLHAPRIQDLPFSPHTALDDAQKEIVKDYCVNSDLPATRLLWWNLQEQITLRDELSKQYGTDLRSKSDAQIAESVIGSEIKRITGRWPKKPGLGARAPIKYEPPQWLSFRSPQMQEVLRTITNSTFEIDGMGSPVVPTAISDLQIVIGSTRYQMGVGGLHSCEKSVSYKSSAEMLIIDRDVRAYYPRIVLNNDFLPPHLQPHLRDIFKHSVESRDEDKIAGRHARAEGKKITNNGLVGKYGDQYSINYSPKNLVQTTITGQLALLMQIETTEMEGIQVISANTDGCVMLCPVDKYDYLCELITYWEKVTGFTTEETRYKALYSRDINCYLAFKEDGSVKGKNALFDPWVNKKDAIFRFHRNPVNTICIQAVVDLVNHKTPISETIRNCTDFRKFISVRNVKGGGSFKGKYLGRVVRWYYAVGENDCIRTESGSKVADSDGAKPCMILPDEFPLDIDYEKYEKETANILEDIGYTKRLTLFDLIEG